MAILSWLQRIVAGFFCADTDELAAAADEAHKEFGAAKAVAALALAQAHRAELELREALDATGDDALIAPLINTVQEARERAREQIANYRERQQRAETALERIGEVQRAAELNREREGLRQFISRVESAVDEEALAHLEAEVRAEAAKLDVLERLEGGADGVAIAVEAANEDQDLTSRARALLAQDPYADVWPGR